MKLKWLYRLDKFNTPQSHKVAKGCKLEFVKAEKWGCLVRCKHLYGPDDFFGYASWPPAFKERMSELRHEIKLRQYVRSYLTKFSVQSIKAFEKRGERFQFREEFYKNLGKKV